MFLELKKKDFENQKLKELFEKLKVKYEVSDCTLPEEKERMLHIEFYELSEAQKEQIVDTLEKIYGPDSIRRDKDGNGIPDYIDNLGPEFIEKRHRKWDDKMHTVKEELIGFATGANTEEEVTYDGR